MNQGQPGPEHNFLGLCALVHIDCRSKRNVDLAVELHDGMCVKGDSVMIELIVL
jgi:hypothetical protein